MRLTTAYSLRRLPKYPRRVTVHTHHDPINVHFIGAGNRAPVRAIHEKGRSAGETGRELDCAKAGKPPFPRMTRQEAEGHSAPPHPCRTEDAVKDELKHVHARGSLRPSWRERARQKRTSKGIGAAAGKGWSRI